MLYASVTLLECDGSSSRFCCGTQDANVTTPTDERHQPTILLVDNNAEIGEVVSDVLGMFHLRVVVCIDSRHAQQWVADLQPHLVILDVEMPELDG